MIKVEHIEVFNFEGAIRGMRNPMNSHDKSDSIKCYANRDCPGICKNNKCLLCIGASDLALMKRLYKAGTEHRKYLRQIFVSMDIVAPDYFFKEFSTYKIGVVENSTSTMHRIAAKEFTLDDFSHEHLYTDTISAYCPITVLKEQIKALNYWRERYLETKRKEDWWQMIQLLPMSYNYTRTVTMNYENVVTIINQRSGHKLDEWNTFVGILKDLPYVEAIMGDE